MSASPALHDDEKRLAELGYKVKNFCFQDSPRRAHSRMNCTTRCSNSRAR